MALASLRKLTTQSQPRLTSLSYLTQSSLHRPSSTKKVTDRIVRLSAIDFQGQKHSVIGLAGQTLLKALINTGLIDPDSHRLEEIDACSAHCEINIAQEWLDKLPPRSYDEEYVLKHNSRARVLNKHSRLGCQVLLNHDLQAIIYIEVGNSELIQTSGISFSQSPTLFLNLNQNPNFLYILSSSHPHFSTSTTSSEDSFGDDKFKKWQNGGGIFHESACIDSTAFLDVGAIVHSQSIVASNVRIASGTVVGPSVSIAHSTQIGFNASLSNCSIGDSCVIHNGVCIGQDGFGFYVDGDGNMVKKPQKLNVIIGNNVEIGANTCIDRGSWRDTFIGDNSKIDNLVQIGHNVVIGKNCMLCGQVGIAGSATIGDYVTMGGRVAVRDHVSIASKVRLAALSCVTKNITEPGDYGGFPTVSIHKWRRQVASGFVVRGV